MIGCMSSKMRKRVVVIFSKNQKSLSNWEKFPQHLDLLSLPPPHPPTHKKLPIVKDKNYGLKETTKSFWMKENRNALLWSPLLVSYMARLPTNAKLLTSGVLRQSFKCKTLWIKQAIPFYNNNTWNINNCTIKTQWAATFDWDVYLRD